MPNDMLKIYNRIADIDAAEWDRCIDGNPFLRHSFLRALEETNCAVPETGWLAQHFVLADDNGTLQAALPCYLKGHSYGEYVFDHAWADAYERAGGSYYPKLQSAVPFTPVEGPRLLVAPDADFEKSAHALLAGAKAYVGKKGLSSFHINFLPQSQVKPATDHGLLVRMDQQFHWINQGFQSFDDFLQSLSSRKRKQIRKERREALKNGITIRHLYGSDITETDWDDFYRFYQDTGHRKWGHPYLTRAFFSEIGETMGDAIVLFMCMREGMPIAGALNFLGPDALYGRYWGTVEDHPFLHFETCYYQAIDYAIAHGLRRVEAGAQGPHKLARGYAPQRTYSVHWIVDPGFRQAVEDYLQMERTDVEEAIAYLRTRTPYRRSD